MASAPLVAFTLPALVIVKGLFVAANESGPVTALLIVRPPPFTLTVNVSGAEGAELGPPAAAWVADRVWLPLPSGLVSA